jgi:hypothetical protein
VTSDLRNERSLFRPKNLILEREETSQSLCHLEIVGEKTEFRCFFDPVMEYKYPRQYSNEEIYDEYADKLFKESH